jgi:hypothetical protein
MKAGVRIGQEGALIGVSFFATGPPNGAVIARNRIALSNDLWRSIRRAPSSACSLACRLLHLAIQLLFSSEMMVSQRVTKADHSGDGAAGICTMLASSLRSRRAAAR